MMQHALFFDKEVEVIARGEKFSRIQNLNDPRSARTVSTQYLKPLRYKAAGPARAAATRRVLTLSPANFDRLCEIFRQDPNFSMPISVRADQEDGVVDEIPFAEDGITIASERKLAVSQDVVFSASVEVDMLLKDSGGHAGPYFNHLVLRVFNGPRKAFYGMLLDAGFKPTHMGVAA